MFDALGGEHWDRAMRIGWIILFIMAGGCGSSVITYQHRLPARVLAQLPPPSTTLSATLEPVSDEKGAHPELFEEVMSALPPAYRAMLKRDRRLDAVARTMALTYAIGEDYPSYRLQRGILAYHGVVVPIRYWSRMGWNSLGTGAREALIKRFEQILKANKLLFRKAPHRIGLSLVQGGARTWGLTILITEDIVSLEPFERQVKTGSQVTLSGRVQANWGEVVLYGFSGPQKTFEVPITVQEDGRFSVSFQAPETPGLYAFELDAKERIRGRRDFKWWGKPVADFELAVGVPVPKVLSYSPYPEPVDFDEASGRQMLLQQLNTARTKAGLSPLVVNPEWEDAARTLAQETRTRKQRDALDLKQHLPASHDTSLYRHVWGSVFRLLSLGSRLLEDPSIFHFLMSPKAHAVAIGLHNKPNKDGDDAYRYGILVLTRKEQQAEKDTPTPSSSPQSAE